MVLDAFLMLIHLEGISYDNMTLNNTGLYVTEYMYVLACLRVSAGHFSDGMSCFLLLCV